MRPIKKRTKMTPKDLSTAADSADKAKEVVKEVQMVVEMAVGL